MLCFRKIPVAKNFLDKKVGGGLSKLFVEIFFLTVPKNVVGEPFILL